MITPHFEHTGWNAVANPADWDALCEDLATALDTWTVGSASQITVKAYDAQGTVPVYPVGSAIRNVGMFPTIEVPREVALCLSYYSTNNAPRRRGRLYAPAQCFVQYGASMRPTSAHMQKVLDLGTIFKELGGGDVDWVVYSRVDDDARPVTNYWVDDEWDTVRSRGMRGTTRMTGTTTEA